MGQVSIPKAPRSKYGFTSGTRVPWVERDSELIPRPVMSMSDLFGYLRPGPGQRSLTSTLLEEKRSEHAPRE